MTREELVNSRSYQTTKAACDYYQRHKDAESDIITAFEDGAEWADEHPISPWISVEDRLPEEECTSDEILNKFSSNLKKFGCTYNDKNLVLEVPDNEPQFKPFDRVLVRDKDNQVWWAGIFSHIDEDGDYCICGMSGRQCIPYEGNQDLVGTTKMPKEN